MVTDNKNVFETRLRNWITSTRALCMKLELTVIIRQILKLNDYDHNMK